MSGERSSVHATGVGAGRALAVALITGGWGPFACRLGLPAAKTVSGCKGKAPAQSGTELR